MAGVFTTATASIQIYPFPGPDFPYDWSREGANATLNTWESLDEPTLDTIQDIVTPNYSLSGAGQYRALILGVDGKLYSPPFLPRGNVLVIDPETDTASIQSFGLSGLPFGNGNYTCGALAPNGKIYCPPYSTATILIINTTEQSTVRTNMGVSFTINRQYPVAVAAADGTIYCPGRQNCLIINTANDTATATKFAGNIVGTVPLNNMPEWGSGVRSLADDKLYFAPQHLRSVTIGGNLVTVPGNVLIIDPETQTATVSKFSSNAMANGATYGGIANGPDGKLYLSPYGPTLATYETPKLYWTVIDPVAGTAVDYSLGEASNANVSMGCIAGDDGVVYGMPYYYDGVGPTLSSNTYVYFKDGQPGASDFGLDLSQAYVANAIPGNGEVAWYGGCLAPNGKIYSLPDMTLFGSDYYLRNSALVLDLNGSGHTTTSGFRNLIDTSYFNKGGT